MAIERRVALIAVGAIALVGIIIMGLSMEIVPAGHVGVYDLFGQVKDEEFAPGFYVINPLAHLHTMSVQTQEHEYTGIRGTLTKEGLEVIPDASVIWHIEPAKASDIYKTVRGDYFDTLITPNFMGISRDEIKKWTAEDIYTGKSTEIQSDVQERLSRELAPRGIGIEAVWFRGIVLPSEVTNAIEAKIGEKQAVEQKGFTVEKQRLEAERMLIEANATAQANIIVSRSITPELIQWNFVQAIKESENVIYVPMEQEMILPLPTIQK